MESVRSYERMTVVQLRELAREKKVRLPYGVNKAQIVELLSGLPIRGLGDLKKAADRLLNTGLQRLFISLGAEGVYAADHAGSCILPNIPGNMVNTTGCGDAFMAAIVWAYLEELDLEESARAGLAAGSIAMESNQTINPDMSAEALKQRMER